MSNVELLIVVLYTVSVLVSFLVFMRDAPKVSKGTRITLRDYYATSTIIAFIPILNVIAMLVALFGNYVAEE